MEVGGLFLLTGSYCLEKKTDAPLTGLHSTFMVTHVLLAAWQSHVGPSAVLKTTLYFFPQTTHSFPTAS